MMAAADDNVAFLRARLAAPLLADIPHSHVPEAARVAVDLPASWH